MPEQTASAALLDLGFLREEEVAAGLPLVWEAEEGESSATQRGTLAGRRRRQQTGSEVRESSEVTGPQPALRSGEEEAEAIKDTITLREQAVPLSMAEAGEAGEAA